MRTAVMTAVNAIPASDPTTRAKTALYLVGNFLLLPGGALT